MTGVSTIEQMARLSTSATSLRVLFPDDSFDMPATHVIVAGKPTELSTALVTGIEHAAERALTSAHLVLHCQEQTFPDLTAAAHPIHGLWFVSSADRTEFHGNEFAQWADEHRSILARIPLHGFVVLQSKRLPTWREPVTIDSISAGGRAVLVSPLLLDEEEHFAGGALLRDLQLEIVTHLLLSSVRYRTGYHPFAAMATSWDQRAAAALHRRMSALASEGPGDLGRALSRLGGLRELQETADAASRTAAVALDTANALDRAQASPEALTQLAANVATRINDGRRRVAEPAAPAAKVDPFASDFQRLREAGLRFASTFADEMNARGNPKTAAAYESARRKLSEEVKMIVLGPFSSGKSTFLNSILGLNETNNPLPTSGAPETTTINELVHGAVDEAEIHFFQRIDLELFERPQRRDRWTINKAEIQALLAWWREGVIDRKRIRILRFDGKRDKAERGLSPQDEKFLSELVDPKYKETHYDEGELKKKHAIFMVADIHFLKEPKVPDARDLPANQAWVKSPERALRVEKVILRRNLDPLVGLGFVDTPGTDSLFAHHHTLARKYIEDFPTSPVICLFDAKTPASEEDSKNITFLKNLNADQSRLFFVITKRGDAAKDEDEVRTSVNRRLRDAGLEQKRVYYIDSIDIRTDPTDSEWTALVADLRRYVNENRTALLQGDMRARLRTPIEGMIADQRTRLEQLRRGGDHEAAAAQWEQQARAVDGVLKRFDERAAAAQARLFRSSVRGTETFHDEVDDVDSQLASFDCGAWLTSKKDEKVRRIKAIVGQLEEWPKRLKANLVTAGRLLHGELAEDLRKNAQRSASLSILGPPADFRAFSLSELHDEAKADVHYHFASYRSWLEKKVGTLRWLLKKERRKGVHEVDAAFAEMVEGYREQCDAVRESAVSLARAARKRDDTATARKEALAAIEFLERQLQEYDAIDPDVERILTKENGHVGNSRGRGAHQA